MRLTKQQEADFRCKNCGKTFKYKFATDTKVQPFLCHCKKCKKKERAKHLVFFDKGKADRTRPKKGSLYKGKKLWTTP